MTYTRHPLLTLGLCIVAALLGIATFEAFTRIAVAHASAGPVAVDASELPAIDDVFAAGRRTGFLWLGVMLAIVAAAEFVLVRLKPKDGTEPKDGWRGRLVIVFAGVSTVVLALIDMFAASRGFAPVATAAVGAVLYYRRSRPDPQRGSKRVEDDAEGQAPT
jgi:hypothetical protein